MKIAIITTTFLAAFAAASHGQAIFEFENVFAPTRIGSIDGPLAGTGIWSQALAGQTPDSLAPVGVPVEYGPMAAGIVPPQLVEPPNLQVCATAYVKMVAWDGTLWGQSLASVPRSQLGMTDTVPVFMSNAGLETCGPIQITRFNQAAVVPVPEPSVLGIATAAGLGCWLFGGVLRRHKHGYAGLSPPREG
jgi:hypothetical protein